MSACHSGARQTVAAAVAPVDSRLTTHVLSAVYFLSLKHLHTSFDIRQVNFICYSSVLVR